MPPAHPCSAAVNCFHAAVSVQNGKPDPVPFLAVPLALAFARSGDAYLKDPRLRKVGLLLLALHFNLRFCVGILWGDRSYVEGRESSVRVLDTR